MRRKEKKNTPSGFQREAKRAMQVPGYKRYLPSRVAAPSRTCLLIIPTGGQSTKEEGTYVTTFMHDNDQAK